MQHIIAIDGPAGAGKSTVAQLVAQQLGYTYIDTGAMYRAISWKFLEKKHQSGDQAAMGHIAETIQLELRYQNGKTTVFVDGQDVSEAIRTPEVSRLVSEVAQVGAVRAAMLQMQRAMAAHGGVVMDGRDIGTHVLPHADIKLFLTASIEARAKRRWQELTAKGYAVELETLTAEIAARDKKDSEREIAPLVQAADAKLLDTTDMSIEQVVHTILSLVRSA